VKKEKGSFFFFDQLSMTDVSNKKDIHLDSAQNTEAVLAQSAKSENNKVKTSRNTNNNHNSYASDRQSNINNNKNNKNENNNNNNNNINSNRATNHNRRIYPSQKNGNNNNSFIENEDFILLEIEDELNSDNSFELKKLISTNSSSSNKIQTKSVGIGHSNKKQRVHSTHFEDDLSEDEESLKENTQSDTEDNFEEETHSRRRQNGIPSNHQDNETFNNHDGEFQTVKTIYNILTEKMIISGKIFDKNDLYSGIIKINANEIKNYTKQSYIIQTIHPFMYLINNQTWKRDDWLIASFGDGLLDYEGLKRDHDPVLHYDKELNLIHIIDKEALDVIIDLVYDTFIKYGFINKKIISTITPNINSHNTISSHPLSSPNNTTNAVDITGNHLAEGQMSDRRPDQVIRPSNNNNNNNNFETLKTNNNNHLTAMNTTTTNATTTTTSTTTTNTANIAITTANTNGKKPKGNKGDKLD
jgi:hypothetical protein